VPALIARYGKDRTFSVPILTHCALAGLVDWKEVISLPFELACIPARFYAAVRLPVVSYALPALIAIGQVRFHFRPSRNPLRRWLQRWAKPASLRVLERIQPTNGGFLEATPLTSFVTMSLAAMGLHDHPVAQRGIEFIVKSARWEDVSYRHPVHPGGSRASALPDSEASSAKAREPPGQARWRENSSKCSWPIDTNLATWVTTLAINALGDDVPLDARPGLRAWLLRQQYRVVHPYTNAAPGGWAWTDLPGGVPDADDTPGVMLAISNLQSVPRPISRDDAQSIEPRADGYRADSFDAAARWLLALQNRDGGWPTFCRGWGTLPFDRSSPDISAHAIRALADWQHEICGWPNLSVESRSTVLDMDWTFAERSELQPRIQFHISAIQSLWNGFMFLKRTQRPDGSWLPLWFGNQHAPNDENPTYGTAKVLAAFQALGRMSDESAVRGVRWLVENQNPDGGWGAGPGTPSSIEETALALKAVLGACNPNCDIPNQEAHDRRARDEEQEARPFTSVPSRLSAGITWLIERVEDGRFRQPAPIGFYFAKLWYFERLYPVIWTVDALRTALHSERLNKFFPQNHKPGKLS
jgi:squalene-hopene/tetraprenyl-beta-curcumene cyclase